METAVKVLITLVFLGMVALLAMTIFDHFTDHENY